MSFRVKLILLYVITVSLLLTTFFIFTLTSFSHAIYGSDVIEYFDSALVKYGEELRDSLSDTYSPFYTPIPEYTKLFNSHIGKDLFLNRPAYGQLRDFPADFREKPVVMIQNIALGDLKIPLTEQTFNILKKENYAVETIRGIFEFPIRVVSFKIRFRDKQDFILQIGMSMEHINTTLRIVIFRFLYFLPIVLVIIITMGFFFVKQSFSPVKKIVDIANRITAEDLSLRINNIESNDDIGRLVLTLNEMISRLEESFKRIKQFSDDVSHELKTPLTVLKGEIEVALRHERDGKEYREMIQIILEETEKLQRIIDNLFFLSIVENAPENFNFQEISLNYVVMETFEDTLPVAAKKNITINLNMPDDVTINGNAELLKRVFANIILNAVKYTEENGNINISLTSVKPSRKNTHCIAELLISDNGCGIPEDSLKRVFDRFFRADKSRSGKTGGAGLGLTIVKKITDLHRAKIKINSTEHKGTDFFVYFFKY